MKKLIGFAAVAAFSSFMAFSAMAGVWKQDNVGWWYDNGNGTYPSNLWQWIDGDNNGTAECYYFDRTGYMLANTTTPDGYHVNASGAWVQNGTVQTRNVRGTGQTGNSSATGGETKNKTKKERYVLFDKNPSYESDIQKKKNEQVIGGDTWTDVIQFIHTGAMIEYSNEAGYTKLRATVAPSLAKYGPDREVVGELIVYGDNGNILYQSGNVVAGETEPFDIEVDITGQKKIQLAFSGIDKGNDIVLKSARFED
jgi:cysteine-rich secretory protein family./putative cell wall binding repeat